MSRLFKSKPMADRDSLPEEAVQKAVTFTEEAWKQAKKKIELARGGIKDVHLLELNWDRKFEFGQSQRVNRKQLRQIRRPVKPNGLTRLAHICGVPRDGMCDTGIASRPMNERTHRTTQPRPSLLCANERVVVLGGQHIGYVVRQIWEALTEHFTEEDIPYQYRYMSCGLLKAGTGVTVWWMLSGLHKQIQRVHGVTTFSEILAKFIAVARLRRKQNDGHIDPLTGDEIHRIMQNVDFVQ